MANKIPYISFTFDDFPRTALTEGGRILAEHGARGTYFVSFQLLGSIGVSGPIASTHDLEAVLTQGHELGCHTFAHLDGSVVTADAFERSIEANRAALADSGLPARFETFAYPLNGPAVETKKVAGAHFTGCRWGGQTFNHGMIDLNLLKAYFLDGRSHRRLADIAELVERNAAANGWLIFATHDIDVRPSEYGYGSGDFESIVKIAVESGARVLPMKQVCRELGVSASQENDLAHHFDSN